MGLLILTELYPGGKFLWDYYTADVPRQKSYDAHGLDVPVYADLDAVWDYLDPPPGVPAWRHFRMAIHHYEGADIEAASIWWRRPRPLDFTQTQIMLWLEEFFCPDMTYASFSNVRPGALGCLPDVHARLLEGAACYVRKVVEPKKFEAPEFDFKRSPLTDQMNMVVDRGYDPTNRGRYSSRSEAVFAVTCAMVRDGVPDEVILSALLDEDLGISKHVRAQPYPARYAARQLQRAKEKAHGKR